MNKIIKEIQTGDPTWETPSGPCRRPPGPRNRGLNVKYFLWRTQRGEGGGVGWFLGDLLRFPRNRTGHRLSEPMMDATAH